jgi:hypothetical protein
MGKCRKIDERRRMKEEGGGRRNSNGMQKGWKVPIQYGELNLELVNNEGEYLWLILYNDLQH